MKTRSLIQLLLGVVFSLSASYLMALPLSQDPAATTLNSSDNNTSIQALLDDFYRLNIREKLYLQTDKPYYSAGDTLWFRGFLVDANNLLPLNTSQYIYVELIDQRDTVVSRAKIIYDEDGFHNCLALAPQLPPGNYLLKAYTQWMRNTGEDFFFKKYIPIGNTIDDQVITTVQYALGEDGYVTASILFTNMNRDPIPQQRLSYQLCIDDQVRRNNARTDDAGRLQLRFQPPRRDTISNTIQLSINDNNLQFQKTIFLPAFSNEFDVQFFPESGHLLPLGRQTVAFKAIGSHGLGIDVHGRIVNEQQEEITTFASVHKGMGSFSLDPQLGVRYFADVFNTHGDSIRVELPAVERSGAALEVVQQNQAILCGIRITEDLNLSGWQLVVLNRDQILAQDPKINHRTVKTIPLTLFRPGIARLALVDTLHQRTLCERLVFIPPQNTLQFQLKTDQPNYEKRQWVEVELSLSDKDDIPLAGSFALSVTDSHLIQQDSLAGNILSDLLLTSDLKGYIEDPGYYFLHSDPTTRHHLDLLMLTQGWTRYSVIDRLQNNYIPIQYPLEWSQSLSGSITGLFGKALKKPMLTLLIPEQNHAEVFELDAKKHFTLSGLYFPDSTLLILQATNQKNWARGISLTIDDHPFPSVHTFFPQPHISQTLAPIPDNYLNLAKQKYYEDGGIRVIDMKAISITAQSKEDLHIFDGIETNHIMNERTKEHFKNQPLYQALPFLGMGLTVSTSSTGSYDLSNYNTYFPIAMLNGRRFVPIEQVMHSPVNIYESIGILPANQAKFVMIPQGFERATLYQRDEDFDKSRGGDPTNVRLSSTRIMGLQDKGRGLLLLKLKEGMSLVNAFEPPPYTSRVFITPLGYKKPEAFYQPKYDVPKYLKSEKPDLRTTIYWNPTLQTDEQGKATFGFYTADRNTLYDVTLEGISEEGDICRYTTTIQRTSE